MALQLQSAGAIRPEHWFPQAWAAALIEVTQALDLGAGAAPLEVRTGAAALDRWAAWEQPLWHRQLWTPGANARLWVGCSKSAPLALWKHIGGDELDDPAPALETFREMLNQSASGAAAEASARIGAPAQAAAAEESPPPEAGWAVEMRFQAAGGEHTIGLAGNDALTQMLELAERQQPPAETPSGAAALTRTAEPQSDPIELIREVNLELAVSFGDTSMPLADVLKLASGAIIELNRSVSDPVEVLVNDSVIARGDVVVVDGNYGVRITEIVSRRDRVRSMM